MSAALVTGMTSTQVSTLGITTVGILIASIGLGGTLVNVNTGTFIIQLEAVNAITNSSSVFNM